MISGNGLPWNTNRVKSFNLFLNQLKIGDSILSKDETWKIIYLFLNSKLPQYAIYHNNVRVLPLKHKATPRRNDIIKFLLDQDPNTPSEYMDHMGMYIVENGCIELMTDITDFMPVKVRGGYKKSDTSTNNAIVF